MEADTSTLYQFSGLVWNWCSPDRKYACSHVVALVLEVRTPTRHFRSQSFISIFQRGLFLCAKLNTGKEENGKLAMCNQKSRHSFNSQYMASLQCRRAKKHQVAVTQKSIQLLPDLVDQYLNAFLLQGVNEDDCMQAHNARTGC